MNALYSYLKDEGSGLLSGQDPEDFLVAATKGGRSWGSSWKFTGRTLLCCEIDWTSICLLIEAISQSSLSPSLCVKSRCFESFPGQSGRRGSDDVDDSSDTFRGHLNTEWSVHVRCSNVWRPCFIPLCGNSQMAQTWQKWWKYWETWNVILILGAVQKYLGKRECYKK